MSRPSLSISLGKPWSEIERLIIHATNAELGDIEKTATTLGLDYLTVRKYLHRGPPSPPPTLTIELGKTLREIEEEVVGAVLEASNGSIPKAAIALGLSAKGLRGKLARWKEEQKGP